MPQLLTTVFAVAATLVLAAPAAASERDFDPGQQLRAQRSAAAQAPPDNDNAAEQLEMNTATFGFNDEATVVDPEPLTYTDPDAWGCTTDGGEAASGWPMRNTIWYQITGTGRVVTLSAAGAGIDSVLAAYNDQGLVACNDDVVENLRTWSALRFRSDAGRTYWVQVGSACQTRAWGLTPCGAPRGSGALVVSASTQPADDDRAGATALRIGEQTTESLTGATEEPGETLDCDGASFGKTRWFRVTVPAHGTLSVSATSAGHDSVVGIYPSGGATRIACNDDTEGTSSSARVSVAVPPGTYDVQLGGYLPGLLADDIEPTVLTASFVQNADVDADGVAGRPAGGDCNDGNAAVHPGAPEIPNNGVDDNCDDLSAVDADGDRHVSVRTGGDDCNDGNPGVRPGAVDVPENGTDEDCDGKDARFPRVTAQPVIRWKFYRETSEIEVVRVEVRDLASGTTASVVCAGRGCPKRKSQSRTVDRDTRKLGFSIRFANRLKRSAKVTLTITRPGHVGAMREISVGRRGVQDRSLCLWPNERNPRRCGGSD